MKKTRLVPVILFCGFLAFMGLGCLVFPKTEFSDMEKRYLAKPPVLSIKNITSGTFSKEAETYLADHVPGRNLFVGIHAYLEKLTGRQHLQDVWVENGKLVEAPVAPDEGAIQKNMSAITAFGAAAGKPVNVMLIPSAGWAAGAAGYSDADAIAAAYEKTAGMVTGVDVTAVFAGHPELYYNTDHHWRSRGAYRAYCAYMEAIGETPREEGDYSVTEIPGFRGSTFARSALWLTEPETIALWDSGTAFTAENAETPGLHDGLFYPERLEGADAYMVFLDGNHSLVRVHNPEKTGKLLVIRDSYSNCLGIFLAENFGETVLVDLRYYRKPVSDLVREENFDRILVCYSSANFLTDTNLKMLR